MDKRTRGIIEGILDKVLETELLSSIKWIQQEIPTSSLRDLALGYTVGMVHSYAIVMASPFGGLRKSQMKI